jgi:hypothetical protein
MSEYDIISMWAGSSDNERGELSCRRMPRSSSKASMCTVWLGLGETSRVVGWIGGARARRRIGTVKHAHSGEGSMEADHFGVRKILY